MNFIIDAICKAVWKYWADLASDLINKGLGLIVDVIINTSDPDKYINTSTYLYYTQAIAGSLLVVAVVWQVLKVQAGISEKDKSVSKFAIKTIFAGSMIYILPWSVTNILLPINNALMYLIQSVGVNIFKDGKNYMPQPDKLNGLNEFMSLYSDMGKLSGALIISGLVIGVSILICGIIGGIRYIELIISILIAPIAAVSAVGDSDSLNIWTRETICVVFTQAIQVLLIEILLKILTSVTGIMLAVLAVGCVAVMIKGPQVLRRFLYSTGMGASSISFVGQSSRLVAMKHIMTPIH